MAAVMEEKALVGLREVALLIFSAAALFMLISLLTFNNEDAGWTHSGAITSIKNSCGVIGAWLSDFILSLFGLMGYLFPVMFAWAGYLIYRDNLHSGSLPMILMRYIGFIFTIAFGTAFFYLHLPRVSIDLPGGTGGVLGQEFGDFTILMLGNSGATLFQLVGTLIGITLFTDISWLRMVDLAGKYTLMFWNVCTLPGRLFQIPVHSNNPGEHKLNETSYDQFTTDHRQNTKGYLAGQNVSVDHTNEAKLNIVRGTAPRNPQSAVPTNPDRDNAIPRQTFSNRMEKSIANVDYGDEKSISDIAGLSLIDDDDILMVKNYPRNLPLDDFDDDEGFAAVAIKPQQDLKQSFTASHAAPQTPKLKVTHYQGGSSKQGNSIERYLSKLENSLPDLALLDERDTRVKGYTDTDLEEMSRLVEEVLQDFNVVVEVVAVHPGPVITRFELQPAAGIKVSRISGLAKDLARALSVTSVRIVEIIPGKSVIGLEIPNQEREMVTLRDLLNSNTFKSAKSLLTLAMGKDIAGDPVVADLAKMPHALVAGTTGSGKSVAINTMILSLLYKATPKQVRMIMIDPKMLELSVYEGIPHLLTPVVTDMKEAQNALRWAVAEMERRYKLMSKLGVRNLAGFNVVIEDAASRGEAIRDPMFQYDKPLGEDEDFPVLSTLPSIVIVIDELADMMMIVGKKVEELIARLAQKARAAGIHLILATQRPSVDVLTGLIKANVPTRISFQVSSRIDSRTILDQGGAEALLGNGDMLFLPSGTSIPIRAHGAFVDDHEVHRVVEFLKQTAPPDYLDEITREVSESGDSYGGGSGGDDAESDALYDQAVVFVTETRKASISSVQRRFKIGYNRAARMIEDMEAAGVVSPPESNGFREVLAPAMRSD